MFTISTIAQRSLCGNQSVTVYVCVCKAVAAPHFIDYAPHRPNVLNDRVAVTHMHEHVFDQHFACNQSATRHKQVGKSHAPVVVVT